MILKKKKKKLKHTVFVVAAAASPFPCTLSLSPMSSLIQSSLEFVDSAHIKYVLVGV